MPEPLIGPIVLIYGTRRPSEKAQKIGLGILVLTAILTLVVFGTGEVAGKGADLMVGQVWTNIQNHRASALPAFAVIEATGIFALFGTDQPNAAKSTGAMAPHYRFGAFACVNRPDGQNGISRKVYSFSGCRNCQVKIWNY